MDNYINKILNSEIYDNEIIKLFYLYPLDNETLNSYSSEQLERVYATIGKILLKTKWTTIMNIIEANRNAISSLTPSNIPQFSKLGHVFDIVEIVKSNPDGNFQLYGYFFNKTGSKGAQTKYGENHYKVAALLGLTKKNKPFDITPLGDYYLTLNGNEKTIFRTKLFLQIPIIQKILVESKYKELNGIQLMKISLASSTAIRRRGNVKAMLNLVFDACLSEDFETINKMKENLLWE